MLLERIKEYRVILASASPRRQELLLSLGLKFDLFTGINSDEKYPDNMPAEEIPLFLAKKKSQAYPHKLHENEILLTADTIVALQGEVLLKPDSERDAFDILRKLSGQTHFVYTGVYIRYNSGTTGFVSKTEVKFSTLTDAEINYYIEHYKPFDKAGAYGIQEWIGYVGVEEIKGSYFNVMGLPIHQLYRELENIIQ